MINIIYISDSNKHFQSAIDEYLKRLGKNIKLNPVKPTKLGEKKQIIQKDTDNINKILQKQKDSFNILLSLNGKQIDSLDFAKLLKSKQDYGKNVNFIIGGAYGLDEDKLQNIDYKLQLSKLTFPHGLALLVLLEQIYRARQINLGKTYHY